MKNESEKVRRHSLSKVAILFRSMFMKSSEQTLAEDKDVKMKFQRSWMVALTVATLLIGSGNLPADEGESEGFWGRFNPFRALLSRSSARIESEDTEKVDEALNRIRTKLAEEGLTEEEIEARITKIQEIRARQNSKVHPARPAFANGEGGRPSLEEIRAHLIERGVDPERIDARIERIQAKIESRQNSGRAGKAGLKGKGFPFGSIDDYTNDPTTPEIETVSGEETTPELSTAGGLVPEGSDLTDIEITPEPEAPSDTPVATVTDSEFRKQGRSRRGGFGRGRNRD